MNKIKIIDLAPLPQHLLVYVGESLAELKKELDKKENKNIRDFLPDYENMDFSNGESSNGRTYSYKNCPLLVYLKKGEEITIIHELVHIIDDLSEYYGFTKEPEFRAYMAGHIYKQIKKTNGKSKTNNNR